MAYPTTYTISYSFTDWQAANPTKPLPAARVDIEFENVATAIASTQDALAEIRRADGALKNRIVTLDALADSLKVAYTGGRIDAWAPVVAFSSGLEAQAEAPTTIVVYQGETWACSVSHTTGASLDAAKWVKIAAKGATGTGSGDMLASNNLSDLADKDAARETLGAAPKARPVIVTATDRTLGAIDVGKTVVTTAACTITLPSAVLVSGSYRIYAGAATALASPTAGSIGGGGISATTSAALLAGEMLTVESDGANWRVTQRSRSIGMAGGPATAGNNSDITGLSGLTTPLSLAQGGTGATTAAAARSALELGSAATLDTGTAANKVVQLDASARLPAVNASQLTNLPVLGVGQTFTNVTSSRAIGTTYTNSTGKPIMVMAVVYSISSAATAVVIDGSTTAGVYSYYVAQLPLTFIVPAGGTYALTGGGSLQSWHELR